MVDYFALLGERRHPVLDVERLKSRVVAHSSEAHPDRLHHVTPEERRASESQLAEVNAALRCLAEPKDRLQHLLSLERSHRNGGVKSIPSELADLFSQVGEALRAADEIAVARAGAKSPMLSAQWTARGLECTETLWAIQARLDEVRARAHEKLAELDSAWAVAPEPGSPDRERALPLAELERVCGLLTFAEKWTAQLREREFNLTL